MTTDTGTSNPSGVRAKMPQRKRRQWVPIGTRIHQDSRKLRRAGWEGLFVAVTLARMVKAIGTGGWISHDDAAPDEIAHWAGGAPVDVCQAGLDALLATEWLETGDGGFWIPSWDDWNNPETIRKRRQRDRGNTDQDDGSSTLSGTVPDIPGHTVTGPDVPDSHGPLSRDSDMDSDIDKDLPPCSPPGGGTKISEDGIRLVFGYWAETMKYPEAKLDRSARRKIGRLLKAGYEPADLCRAVDGCVASKFHQGENKTGERIDGLSIVFRNAERVEWFKRKAIGASGPMTRTEDWAATAEIDLSLLADAMIDNMSEEVRWGWGRRAQKEIPEELWDTATAEQQQQLQRKWVREELIDSGLLDEDSAAVSHEEAVPVSIPPHFQLTAAVLGMAICKQCGALSPHAEVNESGICWDCLE